MLAALTLLLGACTPAGGEASLVEVGERAEAGSSAAWIRQVNIRERGGRWILHLQTEGLAASVEWVLDVEGNGEPHYLVADAWSPEDDIQDWMLELPPATGHSFVLESAVPVALGLGHFFRVQGPDGDTVDCALFGPGAASWAVPRTVDIPCVTLGYEVMALIGG